MQFVCIVVQLGKAIIERDEGQIRCKITNNKMKQRKYGKKKPVKSLQAQEPVPALNLVFAQKRRGTEVCLPSVFG